ncbi:MAG: hypothetical protein AAGC67_20440 [Myxococcota bacterium]
MLRITLIVLLLCSLPGMAEEPDAASPDALPAAAWSGVWRLDADASDSVEPMLEVMRAPWIARKAAAVMTPTMRITALAHGGLRVINENPIQTTDQEIFVDGVKRDRLDPLDRKVVRSATWNDTGELVVRNWNHVASDAVVEVTSTWQLAGDTIEIRNAIEAEGDALLVRRVFRKQ